MSKKYLTLLTGILISGCNSNGTASKVSPQVPQVIKSVASSVSKAKVGAILGTYVCTFHNHKTGVYGGQIPTFINVPGEFKKLQNIPFTGKALDVSLFMPSEAPDFNKIIEKCEDLNLDPDDVIDDVIDGVKISTDLKSSFLYDIYNPNLNVTGKDNFLEELNKRSNVFLSNNIKSGAQFMLKTSTLEEYKAYNFAKRGVNVSILGSAFGALLLHSGNINSGTFKSEVFDPKNLPKSIGDIKKSIDNSLFYIDSETGYSSVQHPKQYKRDVLNNDVYSMVADFIAAYDSEVGFELSMEALTHGAKVKDMQRLYWEPKGMSYQVLYDENNKNLLHVYVKTEVVPIFQDYIDKTYRNLKLGGKYSTTIDYVLDKSKYKKPTAPDKFGNNSVSISKVTPIQNFTMFSMSFSEKGIFTPAEDFMRQIVFNSYQNQGGKDYIDEGGRRVRNNDVWVLK